MYLLFLSICPYIAHCYDNGYPGNHHINGYHDNEQTISDHFKRSSNSSDQIWKLRFRPDNYTSNDPDNPFRLKNIENLAAMFSGLIHGQFEAKTNYGKVARELRYMPYDVTGGYDTLSIVSEHVEETLWKAKGMLRRLRTQAQNSFSEYRVDNVTHFDYLKPSANLTTTMNVTIEYSRNSKFSQEVNLENSSISLPLDVYFNWTDIRRTVQWTQGLDKVFTNNLNGSTMGFYQHFSTPEGLMRSYPSLYHHDETKQASSSSYDPRQKTWYSTGSMEPKSIVFLIDGSGSIFGEARRLLKETAKSVLHSLVSDLDYIDIAVFRDNTTSIFDCEDGAKLRRTTQAAKSYLTHYVENKISWYGVSNFTNGFQYAFDALANRGIRTCHKLIVLFTDYTNEDLIPYIEQRDHDNDGETHVVIFTFGYEGWIRKNLSDIAEHFEGYAVKIKNLPQIFTAARGITNVFARKGLRESTVQFPFSNSYIDGWGQGYIVTLLLPVLSKGPAPLHFPHAQDGSFLGVAGIDLPTGMFGEYRIANQQGCHMQAVNARGYVVYHPLFKQIVMEELDVKYHQFRFLVNSTTELELENHLVYQNSTDKTIQTQSPVCDTRNYFKSTFITKYVVFMNPIEHSDFSLALFCPNERQLKKNLDSDIKDMRLMDLLDRSNLVEFPFSYHCRFDKLQAELKDYTGDLTVEEFYNDILEDRHYDCADTLLQVLYETHQLREIDLPFGSFVIMSTGNRYNKDRRLQRYLDDKTTILYSMVTAVSNKANPIVVLEDGDNAFIMARTVYHSTGLPMAIIAINMTSFSFNIMAEQALSTATLQSNYMYILDHGGHIVYTNRDDKLVGKFIGHIEPCAMTTLHREGVFLYHEEGQCFHVCERVPASVSSSAIRLSNLIRNSLMVVNQFTVVTYRLLVLALYSLLHQQAEGHEKLQCCKYKRFYQREETLPRRSENYHNGCLKYLVSPIKETNLLLLVTPRDSRCRCLLDPITLQSPPPTFTGPCTMDDRNYNGQYQCSAEIEHDPSSHGQMSVLSRLLLLSTVMLVNILLYS